MSLFLPAGGAILEVRGDEVIFDCLGFWGGLRGMVIFCCCGCLRSSLVNRL